MLLSESICMQMSSFLAKYWKFQTVIVSFKKCCTCHPSQCYRVSHFSSMFKFDILCWFFFLSVTFFSFYFEDFVSKNQNTRKINDWWNTFLQELPGRVQRLPVHDFWRPTSGRQDAHWSSSGRDRQFLCLEVLKKEDSKIFFNSCKRLHLWSFNFLVFHQKVHVN